MNTRCVDAAFYWTPEEACAIIDYLDHLRDMVWEIYSEDIIDCRTPESGEPGDPRWRHHCIDDETYRIEERELHASKSANHPDTPKPKPRDLEDNKPPREALPSLDNLPSLSDENIGDMLNLLRALLDSCEDHYKDPIRRLNEQRKNDCARYLRMPSMTDSQDDRF
jgi:hypothetical protein